MAATALEEYVDGFRDRLVAMRQPGQETLDEPGVLGLIGRAGSLEGRVLICDDRAADTLVARRSDLNARVVYVLDAASACRDLLARTGAYRQNSCTAMVRRDLSAIPDPVLPGGLAVRPVADTGLPSAVALVDAAAAALRSDPAAAPTPDLDDFVDYLRSIPNATYLAAVDGDAVVRATAASATWGTSAGVFFVNTDPTWRGRGVGTAMTAVALRAAVAGGASRACLDASGPGLSIYLRLGFEVVGGLTQLVAGD